MPFLRPGLDLVVLFCLACASVGCATANEPTIRTFPSTPRAISELKRGWADAVVGDYPVVVHTARESMGTLEVAGGQFATGMFGIGVSKDAPALKAAITDALRKSMEDQKYINALRNWALHIGKIKPPAAPASPPEPSSVPQLQDGTLHVGIEMSFPPMEFRDELDKPVGADVEIAKALGEELGVEVEFVNMAFDSLIKAVQSGQVDVLISAMTVTPEREAHIDFVPYLEMGSGILVIMGNPKRIRRPEDLCGKTVALQEGTTQIGAVKKIECW
ncbi:MAG: transporter substrate-binding domain-containing protein [Myxococcales bacterium]|jgi:ABC-type amino acid transport substrate-binding protein